MDAALTKNQSNVLHYRLKMFILGLGVKITFKRVISFKQSRWLANYINDTDQLRTEAKASGDAFFSERFQVNEQLSFRRQWKMLGIERTCI